MPNTPLFDEARIAVNRLRAARRFEPGADFLLDIVSRELAERLEAVERHFPVAAELHGYSGLVADALRKGGKVDTIMRIETSRELLAGAEGSMVASLEHVPLAPESLDLVVSPLSLHLTNDTPGVFIQICRALRPDGLFLATLPGAGTLSELRESLLAAEAEMASGVGPRVIPFADVRDAGALLQRGGFALPVADIETYTVRYDTMFGLVRDLRAMGMQNPLIGRSSQPLSRATVLRAASIYAERFSDADGRIRATFNIIYLSGWRPHESQQKPLKPGSARVSLADVLK
ncbi:methyltransferase domain-containing protein [Pararhizobium haloflavum]|uniref:methyltransferase domain-containing protein n=1 Tax=Pararhizobium haloflavum TaxID=2037914 RepID=UPI000C1A29CF|nr:methyltransferase domain-containing protein [Pararhizobium haloflavum]